jgi:hypothetical protein
VYFVQLEILVFNQSRLPDKKVIEVSLARFRAPTSPADKAGLNRDEIIKSDGETFQNYVSDGW